MPRYTTCVLCAFWEAIGNMAKPMILEELNLFKLNLNIKIEISHGETKVWKICENDKVFVHHTVFGNFIGCKYKLFRKALYCAGL